MTGVVKEKLSLRALDKFILGELMEPFFFGIMAFSIILIAGSLLFKIADLVIQRGVSLGIVIRLFLYYLPKLVAYTIPMSCLLAALLGFGKLSSNSEIVALKSAGLSFSRIVRPVFAASCIVSIATFFINETLVPVSERAAANVMMYEVMKQAPPVFKEKVFLREEGRGGLKRMIYVGRIDVKTGEMRDILVDEFENGRIVRIVTAREGKWIDGSWWMFDGRVHEIDKTGAVSLLFTFERQALNLKLGKGEIVRADRKPDEMTIPELCAAIKMYKRQGLEAGKLIMMMHLRLSVPWACIVLALVGAALGSRPQRSSSSVGFGLSVIIVFIYYVIMSFSGSLGEAGYLPPVVAAWTANAVFFILGMFLCSRANRLG